MKSIRFLSVSLLILSANFNGYAQVTSTSNCQQPYNVKLQSCPNG
jgi:hypothetical protein